MGLGVNGGDMGRDTADLTVRVEARFKNARLYNAIAAASVPLGSSRRAQALHEQGPVAAFCRLHGLVYQSVSDLLGLRAKPVTANGEIRAVCLQLAAVLEMDVKHLFPAELYEIRWPRRLVTEASHERFLALGAANRAEVLQLPASQEEDVAARELRDAMTAALDKLDPRMANVLRWRYGLDGEPELTYEEIGAKLNLTRERARQIEYRALRQLRHPSRSRALRGHLA
jgi:RNA polymerase sigma factor (sigma-70 family)